jgi:hypothetical protein
MPNRGARNSPFRPSSGSMTASSGNTPELRVAAGSFSPVMAHKSPDLLVMMPTDNHLRVWGRTSRFAITFTDGAQRDALGNARFTCDPFATVKEPECLAKWQLLKINTMVQAYQATVEYYQKLAPMQEKMFKVVERELNDMNEGESWKTDDEDDSSEADGWDHP